MSQLKLLLLFIGFLCLNEVYGDQTIQLTQKMYDDLMTKEFINHVKETVEKIKDPMVFEELINISGYGELLFVTKEKYPTVYRSIKEYADSYDVHVSKLKNKKAREFYDEYTDVIYCYLSPFETDLKDSFVKFTKIVVPKWKALNEFERADFAKEFSDIAKILDDKNIQAMAGGDKSITIETSASKKVDENQSKKDLWQKFREISGDKKEKIA